MNGLVLPTNLTNIVSNFLQTFDFGLKTEDWTGYVPGSAGVIL